MQKFLKVTNAPVTGQLIAIEGIKAVATASATATTVTVKYLDGTTTLITTAAQVGSDVYEEILAGITAALQTEWKKPYYLITSPKAVTSIENS
tara:strand:+ start:67 stop:345 length:279 start_codon:yes stop_codon:yes gene_type:complete